MPSTTPYVIWIRGIDSHLNADSNSECVTHATTDSFPTHIKEPSVANGWMEVGVYAAHPEDIMDGEPYVAPGGHIYDDFTTIRKWEFVTEWYTFPTDESVREALYTHLRKQELFIAFKTYEASAPQHTTGKVIAVTRAFETTHEDAKGRKRVPLTLTKRVPY